MASRAKCRYNKITANWTQGSSPGIRPLARSSLKTAAGKWAGDPIGWNLWRRHVALGSVHNIYSKFISHHVGGLLYSFIKYTLCILYVSIYLLLVGPMDFTWKHEESTKDMKVVALIQYTLLDINPTCHSSSTNGWHFLLYNLHFYVSSRYVLFSLLIIQFLIIMLYTNNVHKSIKE